MNKTFLAISVVVATLIIISGSVLLTINGPDSSSSANTGELGNGQVAGEQQQRTDAPNFNLQKINDGGNIELASYEGSKPVILDFFASWCPNCQRDMPTLSGYYEKYSDQVEVIGVNLNESEATVEKYISDADIKFPIVLDPGSDVARSFGVQYTNYHVLINTDGTLFGAIPGDISEEQVLQLIEANN